LQWLAFVEETYPDALNVANIVLCWMYSKFTPDFNRSIQSLTAAFPLDSNDMQAVRKLEESLPEDLLDVCQTRHRDIAQADGMDQGTHQTYLDNDAAVEQNIIELRFHMALRETLEALDEAEERWGDGPASSLPK
jgi:hypothetical protein